MELVSSKKLVARLISDINLDISDVEHRIFEWIDDAIDIMDITKHYTFQKKVVDIENGKGQLPCGMDFLHSIWTKGCGCGGSTLQYVNLTNSPLVFEFGSNYENIGTLGSIQGNTLQTSFNKGKILVIYKAPSKDKDGYPMIPKSAKLNDAIMYYIIQRLHLKGIKHPTISFEAAYSMWTNTYVGAANDVEWFTIPELEEFSRLWGTIQLTGITSNLYIN